MALVYATGNNTEIGMIAGVTHQTQRVETPISRELRHFIRIIITIALVLGSAFFAAGWCMGNPFWTNLVFAIGIIVANVPEGLLPTVTLALAVASRKMASQNALLKTLESAETLGSTTVICTDKTGTLTQNDIRVTDVILAPGRPSSEREETVSQRALRVMALCNNATIEGEGAQARFSGDPTETALLRHVEAERPGGVAALRAAHRRIHEHPFDSATREMATLHETPGGAESCLKGAPEVVVRQCARVRDGDGSASLAPEDAAAFLRQAERLARSGKRVLALAGRSVTPGEDPERVAMGGGHELIGLVAMHDPPRPEVPMAVARCREAGIRVLVVSGDHPLTVEAIARQVGIIHGAAPAVHTGTDLAEWSPSALRHVLAADEIVFARTSPLDKLRIVTALQQMGNVVAVTGVGL
jgi:sodium/potassium-transporting ATPase subunit alpha